MTTSTPWWLGWTIDEGNPVKAVRNRPDLADDIRRQIALDPPRFRGVLHSWAVPAAALAGVYAVIRAPGGWPRVLVAIYGVCLVAMYLFSATFHRRQWSDDGWWRMRQLDHTGIYLVIAGSFTGIAGLALDGTPRAVLLSMVWLVTLVGVAYRWSPLVPPFGMMTLLFVLLTALVVPFLGRLGSALGAGAITVLMVGCAVYLVGALMLGARKPDPWPQVFGYHEVWHVFVVVGSILHYIVLIAYAIPAAEELRESAWASAHGFQSLNL
ncbi:MAG: hemolysin III family protein [Actinomycetota bacterium]